MGYKPQSQFLTLGKASASGTCPFRQGQLPASSTWAVTHGPACSMQCSAVPAQKSLILPLERCFVSEAQWTLEHVSEQRQYASYANCPVVPCCPISIEGSHWPLSLESQWAHMPPKDSKWQKGSCEFALTAPEASLLALHSNQNLLGTQKESNGFLRTLKELYHILSHLLLEFLPVISNQFYWRQWHKRKGNASTSHSSLPLLSQADVESTGWTCTYQEVKLQQVIHFVPCFHSPGQNKLHFAWNVNCVISVILHTRWMVSYLLLKLAWHDIKLNGKIHANNLKLQFVFT